MLVPSSPPIPQLAPGLAVGGATGGAAAGAAAGLAGAGAGGIAGEEVFTAGSMLRAGAVGTTAAGGGAGAGTGAGSGSSGLTSSELPAAEGSGGMAGGKGMPFSGLTLGLSQPGCATAFSPAAHRKQERRSSSTKSLTLFRVPGSRSSRSLSIVSLFSSLLSVAAATVLIPEEVAADIGLSLSN